MASGGSPELISNLIVCATDYGQFFNDLPFKISNQDMLKCTVIFRSRV